MAIDKRTFRNNLQYYMSIGMSAEEALQYMLQKHGFDASISSIPTHINSLVNSGIPFERALKIAEDVVLDNDLYSYKAALQEYNRKRRMYRSPEPNGRDRIDVDKIVRDTLSNKPESGNGYYPPMGMSTFPNSQHSQYSVVPKQPITEDMSPIPTKYPYELGTIDNQDLAPEGKLGLPISGMHDESAVSMDEPSGKVVVGPDTEVPAQSVRSVQPAQPVAKPLRRAPKPKSYVEPVASTNKSPVVNNTPVDNTPIVTSNVSIPVAAPTLSSVTSQAIRHNGGFDNYRRQSVLSALRAAGGISPAEAVQRGIIPWEALNYV